MRKMFIFLQTPRYERNLRFKSLIVLVFLFCFFLSCFEVHKVYAVENDTPHSYEYDANGRLIRVKDKTGKIIFEYQYDHLGNIISNGKKSIQPPDSDNTNGSDNSDNSGNSGNTGNTDNSGNSNSSKDASNSDHTGNSGSSNSSGDQKNSDHPNKSKESGKPSQSKSDDASNNSKEKDAGLDELTKQEKTDKIEAKLSNFNDIKGHWAKEDIAFVLKRGYFVGTSNTSFSPNLEVDRAMMVTVLARVEKSLFSLSMANPAKEENPALSSNQKDASIFQDVKKNSYYVQSLNWAYSNKIIKGISPTSFAPTDKLTREQLAVILLNYLKFKNVQIKKDPSIKAILNFRDKDQISPWAKEALEQMVHLGILKGRVNGDFAAKDYVTRAEIAIVIKRLINLLEHA